MTILHNIFSSFYFLNLFQFELFVYKMPYCFVYNFNSWQLLIFFLVLKQPSTLLTINKIYLILIKFPLLFLLFRAVITSVTQFCYVTQCRCNQSNLLPYIKKFHTEKQIKYFLVVIDLLFITVLF